MPAELNIPSPNRSLSHQSRHHRTRPLRLDRPDLRPGNNVWWNGGLYHVECIEQHGKSWIAVLVKPGTVGQSEVQCWFASVSELRYDPS